MPVPSVWGPSLWRVLHCLTIRASQNRSSPKCKEDEKRELAWLFVHLESIISCIECKKHIEEYKKKNPLPSDPAAYAEWTWVFHEAVNERLGKPPGPAYLDLQAIYSSLSWVSEWNKYRSSLAESVIKGSVHGIALRDWTRHAWLLNGCY